MSPDALLSLYQSRSIPPWPGLTWLPMRALHTRMIPSPGVRPPEQTLSPLSYYRLLVLPCEARSRLGYTDYQLVSTLDQLNRLADRNNGSADGSADYIADAHTQMTILQNGLIVFGGFHIKGTAPTKDTSPELRVVLASKDKTALGEPGQEYPWEKHKNDYHTILWAIPGPRTP